MELFVWHSMVYRYASEVARSTQYVRLRPCLSVRQKVLEWHLELPGPSVRMMDAFDNLTEILTLDRPHQEIRLLARGRVRVETGPVSEPAGRVNPRVFLRATDCTAPDESVRAWVADLGLARHQEAIGVVTDLLMAVQAQIRLVSEATAGHADTAATTLAVGAGTLRDRVHVLMAAARLLGFPARYVSGYACTADGTHLAVHGWTEIWMLDRWQRVDPSPLEPDAQVYLALATGLDERDACPVRGVRLGGGEEVVVSTAINAEWGVQSGTSHETLR